MAVMRLFFAIPVAAAGAAGIEKLRLRIAAPQGSHWLEPRDWHITLAFLGEIDGAMLPALCELGEHAAAAAMQSSLRLNQLHWWPGEQRPRLLVAAGEATHALAGLRKLLTAGLRELGVNYDGKPLRPHVTLLRLERAAVVLDLSLPECAVDVEVESLALYRSERDRGVTHYRPVWQRELPGLLF